MRRRKLTAQPQNAGLDRWLVSYADYMTLVFALFVVLYAIHASKVELQQPLLDGLGQALVRLSGEEKPARAANTLVAEPNTEVTDGTGSPLVTDDPSLAALKAELELNLTPFSALTTVELSPEGDWLTLAFNDQLLFTQGSALLMKNAEQVLRQLIGPLAATYHFIRVRGYSDNIPISNELYASNWQLSAERARTVLEWLLKEGIEPPRLALEAYGVYQQPSDATKNKPRRALQRRVEIAISKQQWQPPAALPSSVLEGEPESGLRVYELPSGGIRIGTTQD